MLRKHIVFHGSVQGAGCRISAIKTLQVYYNFAERRAYYVINGKPEGLFIEF